jgi:hypothetical protein
VADFYNAVVRLNGGAASVPAFDADVARAYGRADIPVKDLADDIKRVQRSLEVERTAVLLFAAAVVLASVVLVGQAVARSVRTGSGSVPVAGVGLPPSHRGRAPPPRRDHRDGGGRQRRLHAPVTLFDRVGHRLDPAWAATSTGACSRVVPATVIGISAGCALAAWITTAPGRPTQHSVRDWSPATRLGVPCAPPSVPAALRQPHPHERPQAALLAAIVGVLGVVGARW